PDIYRLVDSPPGRQKLATSAPANLLDRNPGGGALHLACEGRSPQAHRVRRCPRHPAALSRGCLGFRKAQTGHSNPGPKSRVETEFAPSAPGKRSRQFPPPKLSSTIRVSAS